MTLTIGEGHDSVTAWLFERLFNTNCKPNAGINQQDFGYHNCKCISIARLLSIGRQVLFNGTNYQAAINSETFPARSARI